MSLLEKNVINRMKRLKPLIFLAISALLSTLWSCGKPGADCFSATGDIIMEKRQVPPFDSVQLNDNINLILKLDSVYSVTVEAGENLMQGISTEVVSNQLVIHNTNACNWTRSYNKPLNVYVSTRNLYKLNYNSSGDVTTANELRGGPLTVEIWGGCGTIDLDLNMYEGSFYMKLGTTTMNLHGKCSILSLASADYGRLDARDLASGYAYISNEGSNDSYVNSNTYLSAIIKSIGNIYFTGNPDTIVQFIDGSGKLIRF
jgi:hypothetical protein